MREGYVSCSVCVCMCVCVCYHTNCYIPHLYVKIKVALSFPCHFLHMHFVDFVENVLFRSYGDICWPSQPSVLYCTAVLPYMWHALVLSYSYVIACNAIQVLHSYGYSRHALLAQHWAIAALAPRVLHKSVSFIYSSWLSGLVYKCYS